MGSSPSILVIRLSAIGDTVMNTAAVRALRRHMPDARITWVVEPKSCGVLEGNPDIDEMIVWHRKDARSFIEMARTIRRRKFDVAIDFQGLSRSAFVAAVSGAKRRIGFSDGREGSKFIYTEKVDSLENPHGMGCYMRLLEPLGIKPDHLDGDMRMAVSDEEMREVNAVLRELGVSEEEPLVALCPATSRDFKYWLESRWVKVADALWERHGLRGLFLGSKADQPLMNKLVEQTSSPTVSAAGLFRMKLSAVAVARSRMVVAVDTGLMHIGVALDKPTVGIFGPTSAWRNHMHKPNFATVRVDCEFECTRKPACESRNCITGVTPEDVLSAAESLLEKDIAGGAGACRTGGKY